MTYGNFKDLPRGTIADKILGNKAFDTVKNSKYEGYHRGLASMIHKNTFKWNYFSGPYFIRGIKWMKK